MFSDAEYIPEFSTMEVASHLVQDKSLVSWDMVLKVRMPWRWWLSNSLNCITCNKIASLICNSCICEWQTTNQCVTVVSVSGRLLTTCTKQTPVIFSKVVAVRCCALLGFYAAYNGSSVPMFRDTPSIPSSRFSQSKGMHPSLTASPLKMGPISCPET